MPRSKNELEYVMSIGNKLGEYVDKWIAVIDDEIIASDEDIRAVYRKVREITEDTPFIMKVPTDRVMVL